MKGVLWLLALFAAAVGVSLAARFNDGYVLVVFPPYRIELSLNLAIALLIGGFAALYGAVRGVALTLSLPRRVGAFRDRRRRDKAAEVFHDAVRLLFEGRFGQALKKAAAAHAAGQAPELAALVAARAAQRLREAQKQELWLERAGQGDGKMQAARLMLEAEMYLDAHRFQAAVTVLQRLQQLAGRHIAALRLELRAQRGCGNWDEVLRLARQLEKRGAMPPEQAREIKLQAHQENVRQRSTDAGQLQAYLRRLPAGESGVRLAQTLAEALLGLSAWAEAQRVIETQLDETWDSELVRLYGLCDGGDLTGRIARAEKWLREQPHDAQLLLALGRLCLEQRLWGKAQSYLEASLSVAETRDAHLELARLFDRLARPEEANRHYRESAKPALCAACA